MTDTLTITTPNDRDVVLTRVFAAPAHLVFDALTRPELITRWSGVEGWSFVVCEVDLRVGGKWRFVSRKPNGKTVGQYGVYQEIVPGKRLVNTELWEDWDAGETLVTTELVEHHGRTTYTSTIHFPSPDVRDSVVKHGLSSSAPAMYDRLAQLLGVGAARLVGLAATRLVGSLRSWDSRPAAARENWDTNFHEADQPPLKLRRSAKAFRDGGRPSPGASVREPSRAARGAGQTSRVPPTSGVLHSASCLLPSGC